jgi:sulfane dehydrogenase subunit SoxC
MTDPTDIENDIAPTSRWRFLRNGGALTGGAAIAVGLTTSEALGRRKGRQPTA